MPNTNFIPLDEQPFSTDIKLADGVFMKTMRVPKAGTVIPQHSHKFAHTSVVVRGRVRVFANPNTPDVDYLGQYGAPSSILIEAGVKHLFETMVDDTIVLCVHDIGTAEGVEILEEHQIV